MTATCRQPAPVDRLGLHTRTRTRTPMDEQLLPDRLARRAAERVGREELLPDVRGEDPGGGGAFRYTIYIAVSTRGSTGRPPFDRHQNKATHRS